MINFKDWQDRLALYDFMPEPQILESPFESRGRQQIGHILKGYKDPTILDIGCGIAQNYQLFKSMGIRCAYRGYDRNQASLDAAELAFGEEIVLQRGHAQDLPYEDRVFDICLLRHILEFIHPALAYRAIGEAVRVSAAEAILSFSIKLHNGPDDISIPNGFSYSWPKLMRFLSQFKRRVSREDVFNIGTDVSDTIIRLRV